MDPSTPFWQWANKSLESYETIPAELHQKRPCSGGVVS